MNLQELRNARVHASEYRSEVLTLEIIHKKEWRCYSSSTYEDVEELIKRYLGRHARKPGFVSEEMYAKEPIETFYWRDDNGKEHKGGLFYNGAVLIVEEPGRDPHYSLFIEDTTARRWGYPGGEGDFVYLGRVLQEEQTKARREAEQNAPE